MRRKAVTIMYLVLLGCTSGFRASPATNPDIDYEPNLPLVFLDATEQIASDRKVPCSFKVVGPKGEEAGSTTPLKGVVRFHGATSQGYEKKSFGVTLDTPVALLGLGESAHWVLNAAFVDRSLMRHKLSYDLFRLLSAPASKRFAAGSRFVELYLN